MSEELQIPPVVDLDVLLAPVEGENPSGESLRYAGIYDEIKEARRADDILNRGDWQTELKIADFRRVIDLAVPALSAKTKDLQLGVWLTEALAMQYGFAGLRDGLKLLAGLQETYWETLHPEIEDGDQEARANAITWLDTQALMAIKGAPITGVEGYSFLDWEDAQKFDIPDNLDSLDSVRRQEILNLKEQAEKERRVTGDLWRKERVATRRAAIEAVNYTIDECWLALNEVNRVIEEKYERNQTPGLSNLKKVLDEVHSQVKIMLAEKRAEEPDEIELEAGEDIIGDDGIVVLGTSSGVASASGAIQSRKDALKRLDDIAGFFKKTEPHSPVAYLVQRAVKWGNMPLDVWLQDVIKDETVLYKLRETLGVGTSENTEGSGEYS